MAKRQGRRTTRPLPIRKKYKAMRFVKHKFTRAWPHIFHCEEWLFHFIGEIDNELNKFNHKPNSLDRLLRSAKIMDKNLLGLLRLRIKRGINLAVRDYTKTSDPYIIVTVRRHNLKTRVVKKNLNPEWNEELTFSMTDVNEPIVLNLYDKDHITNDDPMGDAEIDINPYVECLKLAAELEKLPDGCALKKIQPSRDNCLSTESCCTWHEGKIVQDMILKLRNVECGEVAVQIEGMDIPGCKGLSDV